MTNYSQGRLRRKLGTALLTATTTLSACGASDDEDTASSSLAVTVGAQVSTPALDNFEDAPASPDADDPALWVDRGGSGKAFVIATLKEAGLQVYDAEGRLVQTLAPPNRPEVTADDPPTPVGVGPATGACPDSTTGEEFGRFNNVDVQYGFTFDDDDDEDAFDIAVVSDRGCDRLRIYRIEPDRVGGPLVDITAADAPRLFPTRFEQPSPLQSPGATSEEVDNPLEDQSTGYGLTAFQLDEDEPVQVVVSQRSRSVLAQFELQDGGDGKVTYERVREFRFTPSFRIKSGGQTLDWVPCREEADEDPQFEGLIVDEKRKILYAAQEVIGIWRIPLKGSLPETVTVSPKSLFEKTISFGAPFWAVPEEDEFACESEAPETLPSGTIVGPGVVGVGGQYLEADVEGLAIYDLGKGSGYLIASSQGDDSFHIYDRKHVTRHLGSFTVANAGETDGHDVVSVPFGPLFPRGAFVMQNGRAEATGSTDPINDFEYDHSTRFEIIAWQDIADPLGLRIADAEDVADD